MKKLCGLLLLFGLILLYACQKEVSFETGNSPSEGSLQSDVTGECLPKNVAGTYEKGTVLVSANNYIEVQVNVTTPGSYTIGTDTVNGIHFRTTGTFTATGPVTIKLNGSGTPGAEGIFNFIVTYGGSSCSVAVTVLPTGGATPATFTMDGNPGACTNFVVAGDYIMGTTLTAANTVKLNVTVTKAGTYTITTGPSNGMTFTATGTLSLGAQTITLTGTGTPAAAGNANFPVTAGSTTCSFTITTTSPTTGTIDYFPRTAGSNWSYEFDDVATDSILVRAKPGTTTIAGQVYNVFEATDDAATGFADAGNYRRDAAAGNYYRYTNLADYLFLDADQFAEFIFLKDNQPAGTVWRSAEYTGAIGGTPLKIRIKFTFLQKDVTVSIASSTGNKDYPNTIVIEEKYEVDLGLGAGWQDATPALGYYKDYYARNVGWIKDEYFEDNVVTAPTSRMEIRRSTIVP